MKTAGRKDLSGRRFSRILASAQEHYPISDLYEHYHLHGDVWWTSQREHVTAWLNELEGAGAYGRVSRGLDAKHMYTHFQCAPGLLWIAEALGEDPTVVQRAAESAAGIGRPATQCAAIGRVIPSARIETLVEEARRFRLKVS